MYLSCVVSDILSSFKRIRYKHKIVNSRYDDVLILVYVTTYMLAPIDRSSPYGS